MSNNFQLQSIRSAQKRILDQIKRVVEQIKQLEKVPDSHPWISFGRAKTIEDLKSPFPSLRAALMNDLVLLRTKLRELDQQAKNVPRIAANRARLDFESEARKKLKDSEKGGFLPDKDMIELRSKAESVLGRFVNILEADPSEENIKKVLQNIESSLLFGTDLTSGTGKQAWDAVERASEIIVDNKDKTFRRSPTVENLDKLLRSQATAQLVGGKIKEIPTGFKKANTTHWVKQGDSLSSISTIYYGSSSYWDIIFFENIGVIGNDPNKLRINLELQIP